MGMKRVRNAIVEHVGRRLRHRYEMRNGVETCTGASYVVQVVVKVTDVGPEFGREVRTEWTVDEAEEYIARLREAVEDARKGNVDV